jgi:hypothetical protein
MATKTGAPLAWSRTQWRRLGSAPSGGVPGAGKDRGPAKVKSWDGNLKAVVAAKLDNVMTNSVKCDTGRLSNRGSFSNAIAEAAQDKTFAGRI